MTKNHTHRAGLPLKHRVYGPGEVVTIAPGPYGDFGDTASLVRLLFKLARDFNVFEPDEYADLQRKAVAYFEGDSAYDGEGLDFFVGELTDKLNEAVENPESDDDSEIFVWDTYEGSVMFHSVAWWNGQVDGDEAFTQAG